MYQEELSEIAKVIWDSVLQLPLENADAWPTENPTVTVRVNVLGTWNGTVTATVTEPLGRKIAAAMLQASPDSLSMADVSDALLEVVNMLGGNFKALMPDGCRLSLPRVVGATEAAVGKLESTATFICDEQPLHIEIHSNALAN